MLSGLNLHYKDRLFDEEHMFSRVERTAAENGLEQTSKALVFMRDTHKGQFRKPKRFTDKQVPYINHPLMMACHALALGIRDDALLASILMHDVVEDTDITLDELPFLDEVKDLVGLLTFAVPEGKDKEEAREEYYERISKNGKAAVIKVIDRCNNVSTMAGPFTKEKIIAYTLETEKYVMPLFDIIKNNYPEYADLAFIVKYHVISVLETAKLLVTQ